jgi:hypothetical protein
MATNKRARDSSGTVVSVHRRIEALFVRGDVEDPPALDSQDRAALRVVLRTAVESEAVFQRLRRSKGTIVKTDRVDHLCDSIRASMDFFAVVKQTAAILRGVQSPPAKNGSLREQLVEHGRVFRGFRAPNLDLPTRMSGLLELIQIELIFFGHMW